MKAKTIAEVVAGEMTYKGDQATQWGDALGIASTIANRAKAYGVSPEDIVSAPGQYNAYGKALPPGVGAAQIARAQKALDTVAQYGPVTPATHYALPSATKNIKGWSSFKQVDQVPGSHVFAIDPQMRAIRTATGVVQAQPNAFQDLVNSAQVGATAVVKSVAHLPQAAAAMAKQGFDVVTGRNTFPAAPGYSDIDQVGGLLGLRGKMQDIKGVTVHHTGKMPPGATAADVVNVLNTRTNKRGQPVKYGAHFVVDQQGVPHQIAPMGTKVWHMQDDVRGLRLSNENMIGIEVMAANDAALTPAQIKGTMALMDKLKADNPDLKAYGHGFLNTHKDPEEGSTIARAFNNMQANKAKAPQFASREALERVKDTLAPAPQQGPPAPRPQQGPPMPATPATPAVTGMPEQTARELADAQVVDNATRQMRQEIGASQRFRPGSLPRPAAPVVEKQPVQSYGQPAPTPTAPPAPAAFAPTTRTMLAPETRSMQLSRTPETMSRMLGQPVAPTRFEAPAAKQARVGTTPQPAPATERLGPTTAPATRSIAATAPPASVANAPMQAQAPGQFTLGNATMTPDLAAAIQQGPAAPKPQQGPPMPAPSLMQTGAVLAGQQAPAITEKTVVADRPVAETARTVKQTRPAPTIAPAPPDQPAGLLGAKTVAAPTTLADKAVNFAQRNLPAIAGSMIAGPVGGLIGMGLGRMFDAAQPGQVFGNPFKDANQFGAFRSLANLAGPVPNPKSFDYGTGSQAISDALSGATQSKPGAVSYSKSTPGYSIKSLGNGMVEKTNQYGAKSYERVGTPGSGILSGQPTTGGLLSNFGLGGVSMPSVGGFFGGINAPSAGTPAGAGGFMPGIGKAVGGFFGGGGGRGWGNTANVGSSAMGYAGPWGGGGSASGSATGGAGGGSSARGGKKK